LAISPTHKFGQIIGDLVEESLRDPLQTLANKHGLYLDSKHPRPVRGGKTKVTWHDHLGNSHDLDYVFEVGGTEEIQGYPKAFIEIAYRRYTKHSRNKAQEMQGAIVPLSETYKNDHPFLGVVLAGVFTEGAITQLRSHGFGVLYFPFDSIVSAFKQVGIDAYFDEDSTDREVQAKVDACEKLTLSDRKKIINNLRRLHRRELDDFLKNLEISLLRRVTSIFVLALHGRSYEARTVEEAINFIEGYQEASAASGFVRYELNVRYTNDDEIRGTFESKVEAIRFLNNLC
jgi:hypothetical protein